MQPTNDRSPRKFSWFYARHMRYTARSYRQMGTRAYKKWSSKEKIAFQEPIMESAVLGTHIPVEFQIPQDLPWKFLHQLPGQCLSHPNQASIPLAMHDVVQVTSSQSIWVL